MFQPKSTYLETVYRFCVYHTNPGVGKLRPAGQLRPSRGKYVAREHVFIFSRIWPAKEKSVARDHLNVARPTKLFFKSIFFVKMILLIIFILGHWKIFNTH